MRAVLSISNFERRDLIRIAMKVVLFATFMVAIDLIFMVIARPNGFPLADRVWVEAMSQKSEQLANAIHSLPFRVDFVALGSSHMQFGFDAAEFSNVSGKSSYNAAVGGNRIAEMTNNLADISAKRTIGTVIVGIDSFSLNESDAQVSKAPITGLIRMNFLASIAYRTHIFRDWNRVKHKISNLFVQYPTQGLYNEFSAFSGITLHPGGWVEGIGLANLSFHRFDNVPFNPGQRSIENLNRLAEMARDRHIDVVLVQTPEHRVMQTSNPERYRKFLTFVTKWCADRTLLFLNFNTPEMFPIDDPTLFFDADHLNSAGAKLFTSKLAERFR